MADTGPITREDALAAVLGVREHGGIKPYVRASGHARDTVKRRLKRAAEWGLDGNTPGETAEGFAVSENTGLFDAHGNLIRQTIRTKRETGEPYEAPPEHLVKGESALVAGDDGRLIQKWIKTDRQKADQFRATIAAVKAALDGNIPCAPVAPEPAHTEADLCTVYPLADLHVGLMSWGKETGADYDLKIAETLFQRTLGRLIDQAPPAAEGVLLGLGDLSHANDSTATTPASGHNLDVDSRHEKSVMAAVRMMVWAVERALAKHSSVVLRFLKGNHDPEVAFAVAVALAMRYEVEPRVTVDLSPSMFWFHRWGEVGMGATHGHTVKPAKMPGLLASHWRVTRQVPPMFGRFYFGHIHHETVLSENGTRVESFGTIAAPDSFNASAGFGDTERSMCSITHHLRQPDLVRNTVSLMPGEPA